MKHWAPIYNILTVLIMAVLIMAYFNICKTSERDFDQARLNIAVDNATEAMFGETLEIEDLGVDYYTPEAVSINTSDSIDAFDTVMCFNYGLSLSEENFHHIENSIGGIALAGSDGYYIAETVGLNGPGGLQYDLKWSLKRPYTVEIAGTTVDAADYLQQLNTYSVSMNASDWVGINGVGDTEVPSVPMYPAGMDERYVISAINDQIQKALVSELERKNYNDSAFEYNFYLPAETTKTGVNPIDGPSILLIMQNIDFASTDKINAVSVSGYKVVPNNRVIAFRENSTGNRYYCYNGQINYEDIGTKYTVLDYYDDIVNAAKDGYYPSLSLMTLKATYR